MKYRHISGNIIESFVNTEVGRKPIYPIEIAVNYPEDDIRRLYVLATDAKEAMKVAINSGFLDKGCSNELYESSTKRMKNPVEIIFPDNLENKSVES